MARGLSPLGLHEVMEQVRDCVCAALDQAAAEVPGHPGCPCRVCLVPGAPAWDGCEDDGQLTIHLDGTWQTDRFPVREQVVQGLRGCPPPGGVVTAAELVVTLLRCAPYGTEHAPPACPELEAAAMVLHVDAVTVANALVCCVPETATGRRGRRFVLGAGRAVGPAGGCVGWEQRVIVALSGCEPCPGEESPGEVSP